MSTEHNKTIARRFLDEVLSQHKLAAVDELFAANFVDHDPDDLQGRKSGIEGAKAECAAYVAGFPDMRVTLEDIVADGDRVAIRGTLRGTHRGEFAGIPPTGKSLAVEAMQIYRFENGRIAEAWLQIDRLGMLQQLGVIPAPTAASA